MAIRKLNSRRFSTRLRCGYPLTITKAPTITSFSCTECGIGPEMAHIFDMEINLILRDQRNIQNMYWSRFVRCYFTSRAAKTTHCLSHYNLSGDALSIHLTPRSHKLRDAMQQMETTYQAETAHWTQQKQQTDFFFPFFASHRASRSLCGQGTWRIPPSFCSSSQKHPVNSPNQNSKHLPSSLAKQKVNSRQKEIFHRSGLYTRITSLHE